MRFTKPTVANLALPKGKSELLVFDDALPGFGLRIRAGGKRTWIVQYRLGAKQRRLSLGSTTSMELEAARVEARRALSKVGLAVDPQAEKAKARTDASITLGALIDRHLDVKRSKLRPRSYSEVQRHLKKDWASLHGQPITALTRADVANRLSILTKSNGPVAADRARSALSSFFTWAVKEGLTENNPVIATTPPAVPRARERTLPDHELVEVWNACRDDAYGRIVRLLILTGQRREEVGGILWPEVDQKKALWSLPPHRTKNHRAHDVPLSDRALDIIAGVPQRTDRDLLFGEGEGAFSGWSRAKASLDRRIQEARGKAAGSKKPNAMPAWRLHDLRRTFATRLADLGVGPHVIEAILNHVSGAKAGVAGTYNRSVYAAERRTALTLWAEHIRGLTESSSSVIVPLRRA